MLQKKNGDGMVMLSSDLFEPSFQKMPLVVQRLSISTSTHSIHLVTRGIFAQDKVRCFTEIAEGKFAERCSANVG